MAYLSPSRTYTCPTCGFEGKIVEVVGEGPHSKKGDTPYRIFKDAGDFVMVDEGKFYERKLVCPNDGSVVYQNKAGTKA